MTNKRRIHDQGMSADRPIEFEKDDILDRGNFAKQLACDIKAWDANESLVIGLYGGWGSGKTSLKNLILRELNKTKNPLSVMQFNPWRFSGKASINEAFFSDLRHALKPRDFDDVKGVRRAIKLNLWSKAMSSLAVPVQIAGGIFAVKQPEIGASIVGVGAGLEQAAKVAKEGAEATKAEAEYAKLSTEELKQSIAESLKELEKPLLVVIDDIDRLSSNEILEIFQLVKSNADFPNIIYLLLCEQVVVTQALDKVSNDRGTEYLEKIVQVSFQVPHPSKETIFKILTHKMSFYIQKAHAEARWDLDRWQDVFRDGLDAYFTNLRHVYRFLGSYYFHLRHFRREAKSEVNPID